MTKLEFKEGYVKNLERLILRIHGIHGNRPISGRMDSVRLGYRPVDEVCAMRIHNNFMKIRNEIGKRNSINSS